jgi:serine/threonine protein kinase
MLAARLDSEFAADEILLPGTVVGERYRVGEVLAWGGMGIVYRATHLQLGSDVAIKTMRRELVDDNDAYERFIREAKNAARLRTSHVAKVFDFGRMPGGRPYLVMELLDGETLGMRLERGPLSNEDATRYLLQACIALADAHSLDIVHRDLKPDNLFLVKTADGNIELKVLDFGIAKSLTRSRRRLTVGGGGVGSPSYMAPEQMHSRPDLDQRADIWSLGAVAYELLTGHPAFDGVSVTEICAKVLSEDPVPMAARRPDVWPELSAIVARCLQRLPSERFPNVLSLSNALQHALDAHDAPRVRPPVLQLVTTPVREPEPEPEPRHTPEPDTEANLDISAELSQISGLRKRHWPARLAFVATTASLSAAAWVWWVGVDRAMAYAHHRYAEKMAPSVMEAELERAPLTVDTTPVSQATLAAPSAPPPPRIVMKQRAQEREPELEPATNETGAPPPKAGQVDTLLRSSPYDDE